MGAVDRQAAERTHLSTRVPLRSQPPRSCAAGQQSGCRTPPALVGPRTTLLASAMAPFKNTGAGHAREKPSSWSSVVAPSSGLQHFAHTPLQQFPPCLPCTAPIKLHHAAMGCSSIYSSAGRCHPSRQRSMLERPGSSSKAQLLCSRPIQWQAIDSKAEP